MIAKNLVCQFLENPIGVTLENPQLSWQLTTTEADTRQTAYHIRVASTLEILHAGGADVWDSGRVASSASAYIAYNGRSLKSRERVWWAVRVWDEKDTAGEWSSPAYWEMGLIDAHDWSAKWIGAKAFTVPNWEKPATPYLRKEFLCEKKIRQARLYACGLGYQDLWLNGQPVTDEVLTPALSRYDQRAYYLTYDVTDLVREGKNAAGVILGDGNYNHTVKDCWLFISAQYRGLPRLRYQLEIEFVDGSCDRICSGPDWKATLNGPMVYNALRSGEVYDARKEMPGWNEVGFDESAWTPARVTVGPGGLVSSQQMTPMRVIRELKAVTKKEVKPGVWILDFGENITGWGRLRVTADAGTEISMRYGEQLDDDGDLCQKSLSHLIEEADFQRDIYHAAGTGSPEEWHARFTYHGFQYVQVTGLPAAPDDDTIVAMVLHTDLKTRGHFQCSHELLNKIQDITRRATLGNYHGLPTDCPHREKNGWTGDAQLSAEQCLLNFNPMSAYTKWMQDFRDEQRVNGDLPAIVPSGSWGFTWANGLAWDSAAFIIPYTQYLYCGDTQIMTDQYDCMVRYLDHIATVEMDGLVDHGLGDWCPPKWENDGGVVCPAVVTSTAYYYVDLQIAALTARLIGHDDEAANFEARATYTRNAFRKAFVDTATGSVANNTQTALACALYQGMLEESEKEAVISRLVENVRAHDMHLDTGILGTKYLLHALSEYGRADVAFAIATQTTFPSWGEWVLRGATTLWEDWGGHSSRNHHMFGDVSAWFYRTLAGINPDPEAPGFKHIIIRPHPVEGLEWVESWHDSMHGRIAVSWKKADGMFMMDVTVPPNTTATVMLPTSHWEDVTCDGASISEGENAISMSVVQGRVACNIGAGTHAWRCRLESMSG